MGALRRTIPCSSKRKIGGQLWCLIWLKEVQFSRKKNWILSFREFRQISVGKKIVKSSCRTCRLPSNWREKDEKKEAYFVPKYRRKTICARNIRGFLFIRKNSCSRLRFGNSFRYSKQKKEEISSNRKKYVKYQLSAPPVYETSCFRHVLPSVSL